MLTLTEDEIQALDALDERKGVIRARLNAQGAMPWAFHNDRGEEVVRVPPQPNRFQRSFIGWAPEDVGYLLEQVDRLQAIVQRALVGSDETTEVQHAESVESDRAGSDGGAGRRAPRSGARGTAKKGA